MGFIPNKFASSKCRQCGKGNAVGDLVWYTRGVKGVECRSCHVAGRNVPNPSPSAREAATPPESTSYIPPAGSTATLPRDSGTSGHIVREFHSWNAYVDCAEGCAPSLTAHSVGQGEWRGTDTYQEAINTGREGWREVHAEVDALIDNIDAKIAPTLQPAFTSYFDVSGGTVDVGRFLDGEPECMVETRLVEIAKPGRVVTILVNGGFRANVESKDIRKRGAAIVGLVDALERMQHSTEIVLEVSCREGDGNRKGRDVPTLTHLVWLKRAEEMLDIDTLMFALANPARHRRLSFAIREQESNRSVFGMVGDHHESSVESMCADRVGADINLDLIVSAREEESITSADKWIADNLSQLGLVREEG